MAVLIFALLIVILIIVGNLNFHVVGEGEMVGSLTALKTGFFDGYNTLDALASVSFCLIATSGIKTFGFSSKKEYMSIMAIVGIVTTILFSSLYIGLGALGNKFVVPNDVLSDKSVNIGTYILSMSSYKLFGSFGQAFLGAMTILTCFTTTVGLIVVTSQFFTCTEYTISCYNSYSTYSYIEQIYRYVQYRHEVYNYFNGGDGFYRSDWKCL